MTSEKACHDLITATESTERRLLVTSSTEPIESAPPSGGRRWIPIAIVLAMIAGGLAWWLRPDGQATQRELAAKAELAQLGALVVMDPERKHVNSVNLSTLKSPETFDRAIALLPALSRLNSLNVDGTPFRDEHADTVGQLASLQDLVLNHTAITDVALEKLGDLSRLTTIYVVDTGVTNAGMPSLGRLGSLKIIDLSGTKVSDNLEPLCGLPDLNWLVAQRLSLSAAAIGSLGECRGLSRLTLRETTYPEEALSQLARQRPGLTIDR